MKAIKMAMKLLGGLMVGMVIWWGSGLMFWWSWSEFCTLMLLSVFLFMWARFPKSRKRSGVRQA